MKIKFEIHIITIITVSVSLGFIFGIIFMTLNDTSDIIESRENTHKLQLKINSLEGRIDSDLRLIRELRRQLKK